MLTGSWIIVCKETGKAVMETFSEKVANAINLERYEVLTAYDYLVRLNQKIRNAN